ncbi:MAG TPA: peptide deformylase [Acidimicrobiales bacterium]|nr:peptide deformylase [Acidimicrobiales bacterium]
MPLEELIRSGTVRPIVRWGDPVLHRRSQPVVDFGPELWGLLGDMFATMDAAEGAGLAAPQVGADLAVFVYDCLDGFGRRRQGLVCNPELAVMSDPEPATEMEGCLSLPGAYMPVTRDAVAVVTGQDHLGEPVRVAGTGTLARCLQHETDHLAGIVMEDRLTPAERRQLRRQHKKASGRYPEGWPA